MNTAATIGIYSPGAMGSALGRAWQQAGARVVSTVAGRSARTTALADGLELLSSLADVVGLADVVVSIGPPDRAVEMATAIAVACQARDRHPVVADLNAIAPTTLGRIAAILDDAGCELLDGSISGSPPRAGTNTRLYLSGAAAHMLSELAAPGLSTHIVGTSLGLASAVKMCTASMYKGFTGLLIQALQTADSYGVMDVVLTDLQEEFGPLVADPAVRVAMAASKADRYPGEMREIAMAQGAAGAQSALFEAMATVFTAVGETDLGGLSPEDAVRTTDLAAVMAQLHPR